MVLMHRQVRAVPGSVAEGATGRVASTVRLGSFPITVSECRAAAEGSGNLSGVKDTGECGAPTRRASRSRGSFETRLTLPRYVVAGWLKGTESLQDVKGRNDDPVEANAAPVRLFYRGQMTKTAGNEQKACQ